MRYVYEILFYTKYTEADLLFIESDDYYLPRILDEALEKLGESFDKGDIVIVNISKSELN